jgi:hypothetical protein
MDLNKIIAWLTEHEADAGMIDHLKGLKLMTPSEVKAYLETDDGKKMLQPMMDSYFTKGLDSWKANNLDKLVEELHNKKHPPEDDRDKELRELREEVRAEKQQRERAERRTATLQKMSDNGLSDFIELVDRFTADTPEETDTHIKTMSEKLKTVVDAEVEKRMKLNKPPKPGDDDPNKTEANPWRKKTWNMTKQGEIFKADTEKAARLKAEAEKDT